MSKIKNVAKYSLIITIVLIVSKIIGFARELIIAVAFGATRESDIFKIATTMPNVLLSSVTAALVTTFIPVFSNIKDDRNEGNKFFNNVLNLVFLFCIVLSIIGIIISPILIKLFASGFKGNDFTRTVQMTRIVMPTIIFVALSGLYTGYLQSYGTYIQPALTGIFSNVVIIVGIIVFGRYGIKAAIISFLISSVAQILVQRPFMGEYKYKFYINLKDERVRKMLLLGIPILISNAVGQINLMVDRTVASNLVAGSISVVDYASKLSTLINQVFIVSITTVLYPMITEKFSKNDREGFQDLFIKSVNYVFIISIPLIVCMVILSTPLVKVLLEHGKFDHNATTATSLCLKYLAIGTIGYAFMDSLNKVFFAAKETIIPMVDGFMFIGLNIVLILVLTPRVGVSGLAMAQTISAIIIAIITLIQIKFKFRYMNFERIKETIIKVGVAGAVMGVFVYYSYTYFNVFVKTSTNLMLMIIISLVGILGIVVYTVMLYFLKVKELNSLYLTVFKRK